LRFYVVTGIVPAVKNKKHSGLVGEGICDIAKPLLLGMGIRDHNEGKRAADRKGLELPD
jgi:hypothetical protein